MSGFDTGLHFGELNDRAGIIRQNIVGYIAQQHPHVLDMSLWFYTAKAEKNKRGCQWQPLLVKHISDAYLR
jgi:hypothetical protein